MYLFESAFQLLIHINVYSTSKLNIFLQVALNNISQKNNIYFSIFCVHKSNYNFVTPPKW